MNGPIAESSASMRDSTLYLRHILQAVGRIESYAVVGEAVVRAESMRQDAIVRNLEIIGETVRQLPAKVHAQVAGVDWGAAIGLQEWLDQGYPAVDMDLVWRTVADDVPAMRRAIEDLLARYMSSSVGHRDL